jgi:hypothetical protein
MHAAKMLSNQPSQRVLRDRKQIQNTIKISTNLANAMPSEQVAFKETRFRLEDHLEPRPPRIQIAALPGFQTNPRPSAKSVDSNLVHRLRRWTQIN